jgi:protease I
VAQELQNKRIAALVDNGFEQVELTGPKEALERAGATVDVVSPQSEHVKGWQHTKWGDAVKVDRPLDAARPDDYDALLLPGGVMNPDKLRMNGKAVAFVRRFVESGKPIAAICHGPWTLIEAGAVHGRTMTSWPSLQTDLRYAGARWVDQECVVDNGLVTARKPDDIPAFNTKMIEEFAEGVHRKSAESRSMTGAAR